MSLLRNVDLKAAHERYELEDIDVRDAIDSAYTAASDVMDAKGYPLDNGDAAELVIASLLVAMETRNERKRLEDEKGMYYVEYIDSGKDAKARTEAVPTEDEATRTKNLLQKLGHDVIGIVHVH